MYTQAHAHMYVYTSSATAIRNSTYIVSNLVYNAYKVVLNLSSCELPPPPPKKKISHNGSKSRKIQSKQVKQNSDLFDRKQLLKLFVLIVEACTQADQNKENCFTLPYHDTIFICTQTPYSSKKNVLFFIPKI